MARRDLEQGRAIVTGASSGIGRALALELSRAGVRLVLLARREDRLRQLQDEIEQSGPKVHLVVGDVTDPAVRKSALEVAEHELGGLDYLINNAGISAHGRFIDAEPDRLRKIMEVNFFAAAEFMREAVLLLEQGKRPMIVNVGSILGHRGVPHTSEYCTSKFALHGLSESIRPEIARLGIDLLVVSPASTTSELNANLIDSHTTRPWKELSGVSAEYVVRRTVAAMKRGRHEIIPSWQGRLLVCANRLAPRLVDLFFSRYG